MQRILRMTTTAVLAGAIVLIVPTAGNAALQPNDSVFFYESGTAMTGTIHNGTFAKVESSVPGIGTGWTAAALGRDTLVLLNTSTGQLQFGTLTAGNYTLVSSDITITKSFTKLTASCDSILFYSPSLGKAITAKLGGGAVDVAHTHVYTVTKNVTSVNASCNTVTFLNASGAGIIGTLKGGVFTKKGSIKTGLKSPQVAHTDTSFLRFSTPAHAIEWGTSNNGAEHVKVGPESAVGVTKIAGTATSALAYDAATGDGSTVKLVNGVIGTGTPQAFGTGWQLIVGGR